MPNQSNSIRIGVTLVVAVLLGAGCESPLPSPEVADVGSTPEVKPHDAAHAQATMALLAGLEGEWELANPSEGIPGGRAVFAVSSAGSVVREIMVPGTEHEMTNLYHMDGNDIVCTHYCAAGNQPRMVATEVGEFEGHRALAFEMDSVSNLLEDHGHYMGGLTLVFVDENNIHQRWTSFDAEGEPANEMVFEMRRIASAD